MPWMEINWRLLHSNVWFLGWGGWKSCHCLHMVSGLSQNIIIHVSHTFYCCLAWKRQEEKCQAWYVLYLELAQCHFFNTLLVKRVTGLVDIEGGGEAGFSFLWESGKTHCRRSWGMGVIAMVIFGKYNLP